MVACRAAREAAWACLAEAAEGRVAVETAEEPARPAVQAALLVAAFHFGKH